MSTIDQTAPRTSVKPVLLERFALRQMCNHLQRIERGSLIIEDDGEAMYFGDPPSRLKTPCRAWNSRLFVSVPPY